MCEYAISATFFECYSVLTEVSICRLTGDHLLLLLRSHGSVVKEERLKKDVCFVLPELSVGIQIVLKKRFVHYFATRIDL